MRSPSRTKSTLLKITLAKRLTLALSLCAMLTLAGTASVFSQKTAVRTTRPRAASPARAAKPTTPRPAPIPSQTNEDGTITAGLIVSDSPVEVTSASIMREEMMLGPEREKAPRPRKQRVEPDRRGLPGAPGALEASQWPLPQGLGRLPRGRLGGGNTKGDPPAPSAPQTIGLNFDTVTGPTETGAFPPDTMGAVGPTQFFVFLNGRMRTFNKATGAADGVINADPDVFFASVTTPPMAGEVVFTSDPQVRYDRHSARWVLNIIDVVLNASTGALTRPNRILIAISDAASNGNITPSTVWTLYQFQGDATLFTDYQSLGIDRDALYIGGDMFTLAGSFNSTKGFVVPKAPLLTASPATVWAFSGLVATPTGAGPFAPRGVDNFDPANTGPTAVGYFIGVDNATFNNLQLRRVTNPGSLGPAPTISANIIIATPLTTRFPVTVNHLGDTGGTAGNLDALDDRLFAAMMHKGRLWTAHNVGVNNTGVAGATNNRNASRWYELQNLNATPSIVQSGTLFDNTAPNDGNQRSYWIPSIAVSGQGHAAMGTSIAGTNERVNAFTTGRLVGDTLGTMRDGPGGAALPGYTASSTAYNPPGDPGGPRRWGDYSFTSVDPLDDMTMWTIQEYCNGTNTYGTRVAKLVAPPPATPSSASNSVRAGKTSATVTITGTSAAGSGFYDPGANLAPPALPFTHISATVSGGVTVNSVTFNSPTSITLSLNTTGASPGTKNVTVTNPDGQSTMGSGVINVLPAINGTQLIISEFRLHGSNVTTPANDEYVELYNNTDAPLNISETALVAITGGLPSTKHTVPANTTIPARGHYLIAGSTYSLGGAATANGTVSSPIADDSGLALFDNPVTATSTDRLDSVGFANTTDPNYFEGTKLTPAAGVTADGEYAFVRKQTTATNRFPQDTGDNANDFVFVSTNGGTFSGLVSVLGAPGPENSTSPRKVDPTFPDSLVDPGVGSSAAPNRTRDLTPVTNGANGTLTIRRAFTNNTGTTVTQLRFRFVDLTTFNSPNVHGGAAQADLRVLNSGATTVTVTGGGMVAVEGTTVATPPAQPNGGGLNSRSGRSLVAGTISDVNILPGQTINVQFVFGVQTNGKFRAFVSLEALP